MGYPRFTLPCSGDDRLFMLISIGWAALAAMFSLSIAFVIWGRDGDNTLKF